MGHQQHVLLKKAINKQYDIRIETLWKVINIIEEKSGPKTYSCGMTAMDFAILRINH